MVQVFGCPSRPYVMLGASSSLPASRYFCLLWRIALPRYAARLFAKCWSLEYLQETCNSARLLPSSRLVRIRHYELPDRWSPQRFPTKKMIIIVTHFCAQVVKFIFAGRKSGQKERKTISAGIQIPAGGRTGSPRSSNGVAPHRQLLRLGSWVTASSETTRMQACPSNRIRSAE